MSWGRSRQEEDDRRERYRADVGWEVYRSGRSMDAIDYDRVSDSFWRGDSARVAADDEIGRMRREDERRRERQAEEERYDAEQREQEMLREADRDFEVSACFPHPFYGVDEGGVAGRCYCGEKRYGVGATRYWRNRAARRSK